MEDVLSGKKKLEQFKVAELRELLEQRGLSKTGVKLDLIKRLKEAIAKEDSSQSDEATEEQIVPAEGGNATTNTAEDAEAQEESADSQMDQSGIQPEQVQEVQSGAEQSAAELFGSEELAYEEESDVEKSAGRGVTREREGTPLQDENGEKDKSSKEDSESKEPDPVIDLHVSEAMEMIDDDVTLRIGKSSTQAQEAADPKKETEQPAASSEPHDLPLERFSSSSRRHLWVSGTGGSLSKAIKAIDLKDFFSKYGKVVSASIVAPKSRYYPPKMYGFVTMKTEKEAELCIRELNLREVKGQKLLIEIAKNPPRVAPVDTYVDPSKTGETNTSPAPTEKSQSRQDGDSSETPPAERTEDEAQPEDSSAKPEGQNQGGNKETEREKKRGSPRGHDLNRNRPRESSPKRRSPMSRRLGDNRPRDRRTSPNRRARSRSPPKANRRSPPPFRRRSPRGRSPPRGDLRRGLMADRRHGHGEGRGPPFDARGERGILPDPPPPHARGSMGRFEGRLEPRPEPRMDSRMDPRPDIIVRTQNELFQRELAIQRHEKQLAQQMKLVRDREMKEKEMLLDQERRMREKEREILDRERRDRQLRDELERELKHKAIREKELIERERKELEEKQRILREKEDRMEQERQQKQISLEAKERELKERERQMVHQPHSMYGMHPSQALAASSGQKRSYPTDVHSDYGIKRPTAGRLSSPYAQMGMKAGLGGPSVSASSASWGEVSTSYSYGHIQDTKKIVGSSGYPAIGGSGASNRSYYPQASSSITSRSPSEATYGGYQQHEPSTQRTPSFPSQKQSAATPTWRGQPPTMSSGSSGPRGYALQSRTLAGLPSSGSSIMGMATPTNRGRQSLGQGAPPSHMTATRFQPSRESGAMRSPYQQPSPGGRPY